MEQLISLEEFQDMIDEIAAGLPEVFFRDLSGGVFAREYAKNHPESLGKELYVMGEYCVRHTLGRFIVIYYGSFMRVYGHLSKERLAKELRRVILHEFRHHLESLAGERDLEVEDAIEIAEYKMRRRPPEE